MRNKNQMYKSILKVAFLAILIPYIGSTTFYNHAHAINGEWIVHSHPFANNKNGESAHSHTNNEIQAIQNLSVFNTTESIVPTISLDLLLFRPVLLKTGICLTKSVAHKHKDYRLRPPPAALS